MYYIKSNKLGQFGFLKANKPDDGHLTLERARNQEMTTEDLNSRTEYDMRRENNIAAINRRPNDQPTSCMSVAEYVKVKASEDSAKRSHSQHYNDIIFRIKDYCDKSGALSTI